MRAVQNPVQNPALASFSWRCLLVNAQLRRLARASAGSAAAGGSAALGTGMVGVGGPRCSASGQGRRSVLSGQGWEQGQETEDWCDQLLW